MSLPYSATWRQGIKTATDDTGAVLYGKRSPYLYFPRWLNEFDAPVLAGKLYSSAFPLVDVTIIPDNGIADHRSMAALILLQNGIDRITFMKMTGLAEGDLALIRRKSFPDTPCLAVSVKGWGREASP